MDSIGWLALVVIITRTSRRNCSSEARWLNKTVLYGRNQRHKERRLTRSRAAICPVAGGEGRLSGALVRLPVRDDMTNLTMSRL